MEPVIEAIIDKFTSHPTEIYALQLDKECDAYEYDYKGLIILQFYRDKINLKPLVDQLQIDIAKYAIKHPNTFDLIWEIMAADITDRYNHVKKRQLSIFTSFPKQYVEAVKKELKGQDILLMTFELLLPILSKSASSISVNSMVDLLFNNTCFELKFSRSIPILIEEGDGCPFPQAPLG